MNIEHSGGVTGQVRVSTYEVGRVRDSHPGFDRLARHQKRRVLAGLEPDRETRTHNLVVDEYLEGVVDAMDQNQSPDLNVTHFAVGTDDTAPSTSNSALNNEVFRGQLDNETDNGKDYTATGFLDSNDANGNTIKEAGLHTANVGGLMVNHALVSSFDKTSQKIATIDFTIKWRDNS